MSNEYTGPDRREGERRSGIDRRQMFNQAPDSAASSERREVERRSGVDRRAAGGGAIEPHTGVERRQGERRSVLDRRSGLDRRRGPGRRRGELRRQAEEGEMSDELLEFVLAVDEYKRVNNRPFPSWSEVFELIHYLGYRKVAPRAENINRPAAEPPPAP